MQAKVKIFQAKPSPLVGSNKQQNFAMPMDQVCEFLTELGPKNVISVSIVIPSIIVMYWSDSEESSPPAEVKPEEKINQN